MYSVILSKGKELKVEMVWEDDMREFCIDLIGYYRPPDWYDYDGMSLERIISIALEEGSYNIEEKDVWSVRYILKGENISIQ